MTTWPTASGAPSSPTGCDRGATGDTRPDRGCSRRVTLHVPAGRLCRSRVVDEFASTLERLLDESHTGYAVVEPGTTLLLDADTRVVLTFEAGVPVLAYDTTGDVGGRDALDALPAHGPYRVELYALTAADLAPVHEAEACRVRPDLPAERLAGDTALAERTRAAAPDDRLDETDPVEAFLADAERIESIREQARAEAQARADEWGLTEQLAGDESDGSDGETVSEVEPSGSESPTVDADGG